MVKMELSLADLACLLRNSGQLPPVIADIRADGERLGLTLVISRLVRIRCHCEILGLGGGQLRLRTSSPLSMHRLLARLIPAHKLAAGVSLKGDDLLLSLPRELPGGLRLHSVSQDGGNLTVQAEVLCPSSRNQH